MHGANARNRESYVLDGIRHVRCGDCQGGCNLLGHIAMGRCSRPVRTSEPCEVCGYSDSRLLVQLWIAPQIGAIA